MTVELWEMVKKTKPSEEGLTESEKKRLCLIKEIQNLYMQGVSISEISRRTGKDWSTVKKYVKGEPENLCHRNVSGMLDPYENYIIKELKNKVQQSEIIRRLKEKGYTGSGANARIHIKKLCEREGIAASKYTSGGRSVVDGKGKASESAGVAYITRRGIFNHLWMGIELAQEHKQYIFDKYPVLYILEKSIQTFRRIFGSRNMAELYLFIENYQQCEVKELAGFAKGLGKDIEAVENAVASDYSNGFVEGTNSKLKMIKRLMYGRCSKKLLEAKMMFDSSTLNG